MRKVWAVLALTLVAGGLFGFFKFWLQAPSDEEQIRALLAKGEAAIERRDLGVAMTCVSRNYSDPAGLTYKTLRLYAMQALYEVDRYDLAVTISDIEVDGDTAKIRTLLSLTAFVESHSYEAFAGPLTMGLKKEDAKRLLVIPARVWKITSIAVLPTAGGYRAVSGDYRYDQGQGVRVALDPIAVPRLEDF